MCGLRTADNDLRAALSQLIGRPLTEDDWRLASLGIAAGGLGARCAAEHAPAAYVAGFSPCRELCGQLWPAFDPFDLGRGLPPCGGRRGLARCYLLWGQHLSRQRLRHPRSPCPGWLRLSLFLLSLGTPPFLVIAACTLRLAGSLALVLGFLPTRRASIPIFLLHFSAWLQRRLRIPLWDRDTACGMCGEVLDRWGDYALACCCGGDRVLRHNTIRDVVCSAVAEFTTVSPELEKPGLLLPPRPPRSWWSSPRRRPFFCTFPVSCCWSSPCRCLGSQGRVRLR